MTPGALALIFLALAISAAIGRLVTFLIWPIGWSRRLAWSFAPGVGLGVSSLIVFVFRRPMFTVELALLLLLFAVWFRRNGSASFSHIRIPSSIPLAYLLLAVVAGLAISVEMAWIIHEPQGDWDAFAIWNSHSRYLYRDGPAWQLHIQNTFHPDYPLLVPSLVARSWRYAGREIHEAGGILGLFFTLSGVAILVSALASLRSRAVAIIAGTILLTTPFYIEYGVSQSADVPLSFYVLGAVTLLYLYFESGDRRFLVLSGFNAGCAAWTKNEGLLFTAAMLTVVLAPVVIRPVATLGRLGAFIAGLAPPLLVTAYFKLAIAPPTDLFNQRGYQEVMAKATDPARYTMILDSIKTTSWSFGGWTMQPVILLLLFIALWGLNRKTLWSGGWLSCVSVLGIVALGYFAIYVITPLDLRYHLDTSLSRLCLHLWPSVLLMIGLAARKVDESAL